MRFRRTIWFATLFALLFSAATPQARGVWQCEGRTCGTTPWFCCCASPAEAQDANCGEVTHPAAGDGACRTACGCILTIQAPDTALRAAAPRAPIPAFSPAAFLVAGIPIASLPSEVAARRIELRGPPTSSVTLDFPSLRAPPAA